MIRIDLLPPELRGNERTEPKLFMGLIGLVVFVCMSAVGVAYGWFGIVGGARNDIEIARATLEGKKPRAEYADRLEAEKKEFTARLDHIKTFSDSRILWTKKLDQLWALCDSPTQSGRHTVWFDQLTMDMGSARAPALKLNGFSESDKFDRLSAFHGDLKSQPFFSDFQAISNPTGEVTADDAFDPQEACKFEFVLEMKDRTTKDSKSGKGAKGAKGAKKDVKKKPAANAPESK